jgi:8-oxo-dGTP pyrophosphatase MutT (NUDIX family)
MTAPASGPPVFGCPPAGVVCRDRPAAYAVIRGDGGRVAVVGAAVGGRLAYWLPGGGALPGEPTEAAVLREVREELGRGARLVGTIGEAIQYFYAEDDACWYRMTAVFFQAELVGEPLDAAEHELCWLDARRHGDRFFHACHAWAALRA